MVAANASPPNSQKANVRGKAKKKSNKKLFGGIAVGIVALIIWVGAQPLRGTIKFGICRVFAEQTITYPTTMKVVAVIERAANNDVRMDFSYLNEYGEYMVNSAHCTFRPDPNTGWVATELLINRQKVPKERIDIFNSTIPFILANPPSLILPPRMAVDLKDLQI